MRQKLSDWIESYRHMDWGVLYLRMVFGAGILIHNIGKMQDYNEIINAYPSFLHMGSAPTFVVITVIEVLVAIAVILGFKVRLAAGVMAAGMLWMAILKGFPGGEAALLYTAVGIFLVITGGGLYSLDGLLVPLKSIKTYK